MTDNKKAVAAIENCIMKERVAEKVMDIAEMFEITATTAAHIFGNAFGKALAYEEAGREFEREWNAGKNSLRSKSKRMIM